MLFVYYPEVPLFLRETLRKIIDKDKAIGKILNSISRPSIFHNEYLITYTIVSQRNSLGNTGPGFKH